MNFDDTFPSFKSPHGVLVALGIMALGVGVMLALFRRLRWL
jgi:Mg2+ and Co2+ transporter CorA